MPFNQAAPRQLRHRRQIECQGFERDDGLWDIEGHLIDTKTYGFSNRDRGEVRAGEPIHEMWLRLTIDTAMRIHEVEAVTDHSPYRICPNITPDFVKLVGLSIGPGWSRAVMQRVGGLRGCTHLVELLKPIATTAYQTLYKTQEKTQSDARTRPGVLNTCHALDTSGVVVKQHWPEFYVTPNSD